MRSPRRPLAAGSSSRRPGRVVIAVAAALLSAAGGCGGSPAADPIPGALSLQSEHFRYHYRAGDPAVCGDVLIELERHFAALGTYLGFAWPAGRKIDYWKFLDRSDFDAAHPCITPDVTACAPGGAIFSPAAVDRHELVHAYLAPTGLPPPLLLEGVAEGVSCIGTGAADATDTTMIAAMSSADLVNWSADRAHYYAAVRLVRALVDAYGLPALMAVYAALDYQSSGAQIDAAFTAAFGAGLDALWPAARERSFAGGYCLTPFACSGPPAGEPASLPLGSCGSQETFQEIAARDGATEVLALDGQGEILVGACDGLQPAPGLSAGTSTASHRSWIMQLGDGRYFVRHRPTAPGDTITGTATAIAPALIAPSCPPASTAVPAPSSGGADYLTVIVPDSGDDWQLPLQAAPGSELRVSEISPPAGAGEPQLCPSCGAATSCQALTATPVATTLAGAYVLSIPTTGTGAGFRYVLIDHP